MVTTGRRGRRGAWGGGSHWRSAAEYISICPACVHLGSRALGERPLATAMSGLGMRPTARFGMLHAQLDVVAEKDDRDAAKKHGWPLQVIPESDGSEDA